MEVLHQGDFILREDSDQLFAAENKIMKLEPEQQRWALFDLQQIRFKPMQIVKFDSGLVVYSIITEFFNINMAAAAQEIGQSQLTVGKKDFDAADTA